MVASIRLAYDATIAVALMTVFAFVVALVAAVIMGNSGPNVFVAIIVFVLTGLVVLLRLRRTSKTSTGLKLKEQP